MFGPSSTKEKKLAPEKIVLPSNRDVLHTELMSKVRLNRYDLKFMSNIFQKYLDKNKPLSTGQNELYEKIVHKYRKQLKKLGVPYRDLLELPWKNGIVALDTLNQKTFLRLDKRDDGQTEIRLYFNFNKKQIEDVRALVHDDDGDHLNRGDTNNVGNGQKYDFTWDNTSKIWHGPFNVYLFKKLYQFSKEIGVQIDSSVLSLIETMQRYGDKNAWTPSVRIVNDRLYVSQISETM